MREQWWRGFLVWCGFAAVVLTVFLFVPLKG